MTDGCCCRQVRSAHVSGAAIHITFQFSGDFAAPSTGAGYYDMSSDASSQTLAVSDFANNTFYVFRVIPTPGTGVFVGGLGQLALRRRR